MFRSGVAGTALVCLIGSVAALSGRWVEPRILVERAYELQAAGNVAGATALFHRSVEGDPGSPYRWCDYAEALLEQGDKAGAQRCVLRALELGPGLGPILMRAVNFGYRTGNAGLAVRTGLELTAKTPVYDEAVFRTWEHMEVPVETVLRAGFADGRSAEAYLGYLGKSDRARDAGLVWGWMTSRGYATEKSAGQYVRALLRGNEFDGAARAWGRFTGATTYPEENAIFNEGFEREPAAVELDWHWGTVSGAEAEREEGTAAEGRWCLRLTFDGTENVAFAHVWQRAVVTPGTYLFSAKVRTDKITTDQGIALRVSDAEAPGRLSGQTAALTGTRDWTTLEAAIKVPAETRLVDVRVVRSRSMKFDNKLAGTAWVDAVRLRRSR